MAFSAAGGVARLRSASPDEWVIGARSESLLTFRLKAFEVIFIPLPGSLRRLWVLLFVGTSGLCNLLILIHDLNPQSFGVVLWFADPSGFAAQPPPCG